MTAIQAAFFDIDGTLTSFETHRVPESTIEALRQLKSSGVKIFICSGRAPAFLDVIIDMIPVRFDGFVCVNGQYCVDGDFNLIHKEPLSDHDVAVALDWMDAHPDVVVSYCEKDYAYFNHANEQLERSWKSLGKTAPRIFFDDARARTAAGHELFQFSPYISAEQEAELVALSDNLVGVQWAPDFYDMINNNGGKGFGMRQMARHFGFGMDATIAFGDGGNDIQMLEAAAIGVAMGNAGDDVKQRADYVTDAVDDDGIMNALKHFDVLQETPSSEVEP
ncbi:Cof-type HAD-IIB family hydrolase [Bifidobacterium choloepi]|uniref:Cof-type HAD-IIB family hydrolase n=1 Tax=Bifidobacterium choloepi TaxID=2614131 RepID=A0A6I5NN50_9BIFI|nr:Cof-type HAD-IIB family hydrolase [Bifidobacterium choloepi]NEG70152.1 Cof-type HAD-IIB family hydrolase [Bifidobacterium choloepi]